MGLRSLLGPLWHHLGPNLGPFGYKMASPGTPWVAQVSSQRQSHPKSFPLAQKLTRRPPRSPRMPPSTSFWTLFAHLGSPSEGFGMPLGVTSGRGGSRLGANPSAGNFEDPLAIAPPAVPPRTSFFSGTARYWR